MSIIKRALLYISRKKSRTAILFCLLFAMGLFALVGISVRASAAQAAGEVRQSMTSGFDLEIKYGTPGDQIFTKYTNGKGEIVRQPKIKLLRQEGLDRILAIDGIKGHYSDVGQYELYTGLDVIPGHSAQYYKSLLAQDPEAYTGHQEYELSLQSAERGAGSQSFLGLDESEWQPFFLNGAVELREGRHLNGSDRRKALVSEEFAARNNLSIGDTITAHSYEFVTGEIYGSPYGMEIVGLFGINFEQDVSEYTFEADILANMVFTGKEIDDWAHVEYIKHYGGQIVTDEAETFGALTFYVDDPLMLDSIMDEVRGMDVLDWNYYDIEKNDGDYQTSAGPLQSLSNLSTLLFVIVVAGCFCIMALLITMWTKSRRTEIGILTSIGISKSNILLQFIAECLVLTLIAFLITAAFAGPVASALGNAMAGMASPPEGGQPYGVEIIPETWTMEVSKAPSGPVKLDYAVPPGVSTIVFCVMAVVAVLSVLASSSSITRLKPRDILMKR